MSTETYLPHPEVNMFMHMEDNTEASAIGELAEALAVSETYSCCTMLRCQLGRAYNVHGSV